MGLLSSLVNVQNRKCENEIPPRDDNVAFIMWLRAG